MDGKPPDGRSSHHSLIVVARKNVVYRRATPLIAVVEDYHYSLSAFFFLQVEKETQKDEGKIKVNELCTKWQPSHHDNVLYCLVYYSLKFGVRVYHPWYHPFSLVRFAHATYLFIIATLKGAGLGLDVISP